MKRQLLRSVLLLVSLSVSLPDGFGQSARVLQAARPLDEGLPEIAVTRLRDLLGQNLSLDDWRAGAEKLAEALIAAQQPAEALKLLDD